MSFPKTFSSNVNGAKFDVPDQLTASLLMKSEKKEFVRADRAAVKSKASKGKQAQDFDQDDNEQEIA